MSDQNIALLFGVMSVLITTVIPPIIKFFFPPNRISKWTHEHSIEVEQEGVEDVE